MPPKTTKYSLLVINDIISPIGDDDKFGLRDVLSKPARRLRRTTQTKTLQRYIKKRYNAEYKNTIMLELEKLKSRKTLKSQNRFNQNKYKSIGIANRSVK